MMEGNNYSLSDIAAITGEGGFGGNSAWLIILFLLIFGGGNFFNRGNSTSDFATAATQNEILSGQHFDRISQQINAIGDGIASLGYNQLGKMDAMELNSQKNIDSLRYDMAQGFCSVKTEAQANTQKIVDLLNQSKIETLQAQVASLQNQLNMVGVVKYPSATTYSSGSNPFCGCSCNGSV